MLIFFRVDLEKMLEEYLGKRMEKVANRTDTGKKIMKSSITALAMMGVLAAGAHGETQRAGQLSAGKPYTVSVTLRQEYDDNINTSPNNEEGSFKTIVSPGITLEFPSENTLFAAGYRFGATYFWDRPGEDWDYSHLFNLRLNHKFSPRFELDVREQFRYAQEAELRNGAAIQRRLGDGWTNTASIQGTAQWAERFSTSTMYRNEISRYDDAAVAFTNDLVQHEVSQDFIFAVLSTTSAVANYTFTTTDYSEIDRDFDTHRVLVGADHYFLPTWLVSARVGAEFLENDNPQLSDGVGPYANIASAWNYLPGSSFKASYTYGTNLTDNLAFGSSEGHSFDLSVTHKITQKLSGTGRVGTSFQTFEAKNSLVPGLTVDQDETNFYGEISAAYQITDYLSAEAGYRHSFTDADIAAREYWRNQVWIGLTGKY